ncbi:MAG: hypothetical protein HYY06_25385 [Deltaproteobacteria bacterium]|nr:hypothetical protein [Deltaproteobacteria bacterium]
MAVSTGVLARTNKAPQGAIHLPPSNRHLELQAGPLPAQGELSDTSFAVLLARARITGATGVLGLRGEKFVYFSRGAPVSVDSTLEEETSEVYYLKRGAADESELEAARQVARDSGRGVGEALLGLGFFEASELFEHKRSHAEQSLVSCFGWEEGSARFEPRDGFGSEILQMPIDPVSVFAEGIARYYDRLRLDRELPVDDLCRVYAVEAPRIPAAVTSIDTIDARVLQLAVARPTLQALAKTASLPVHELRQRLFVLYCLGLVGFELGAPIVEEAEQERQSQHPLPAPKPSAAGAFSRPRPPGPGAPAPPPRTSAPPPMRAPAPLAPTPPPRPSVPTPSPATRQSVPAAAQPRPPAPTGPATPVAQSKPPSGSVRRSAARTVEDDLDEAEIARAGGDCGTAIETLRAARSAWPDDPRVWAQLALMLLLLDERKNAKEANQLARDARKVNPSLPIPYVVMGILMEQIHDRERALQMYRYALTRDPECNEAHKRIERLEKPVSRK